MLLLVLRILLLNLLLPTNSYSCCFLRFFSLALGVLSW
jgi:hypothetical protein